MMTREMMMEALKAVEADISYEEEEDVFEVTVEDFEGFDEDWCEIIRKLDDAEAVKAFIEMLRAECSSFEDDFYVVYHFEGFDVQLGYASFNI